jgi:Tfp pilus assembly protein PilF
MPSLQSELNRGWQMHQQQRIAEAEQIYRQVLAQAPQDANAWCYLGIALNDQRRYQQAVEAYEKALVLDSQFPIALNNLGNSLRYLGQIERADDCFQKAIDLKPDYFNAFKNRGTLHAWNGNYELALQHYSQALELSPNDAELHRNLGVIFLLLGKFRKGWNEYRWRWQVGDLKRLAGIPVWDGSSLENKSIVLTAEQGLGDTLQFVRFAQLLRQCGARTLVYCQPALLALLQNSPQLGSAFPNNLSLNELSPGQRFDFQCSLLDVADILNIDQNSIPGQSGYISPAEHLVGYWRCRLAPGSDQAFRVGIAWQGNPEHQADMYRSVALSHFLPLSLLPGIQLVNLQRGFGSEQAAKWAGRRLLELGPDLDTSSGAFMDTAAVMRSLDLVISSDTSIAHLAGALGVPTWIALSYVPDWRWLLERKDTPWYSSVRLFRQPTMGDWSSVFAAMCQRLAKCVERKSIDTYPIES